jgi:hypothetical protein
MSRSDGPHPIEPRRIHAISAVDASIYTAVMIVDELSQ